MRWFLFATAAILLAIAGFLFPMFKGTSNCGGNSAALAACKSYIVILQLWAEDHPNMAFQYSQADAETKQNLARLPGASWIRSTRLLARLEDVRVDPTTGRQIIMVCERAFDNVPQRIFRRAPMAHAVAYSTGETGLITPDQFTQLDLRGFVDVQTLSETNMIKQVGPSNSLGNSGTSNINHHP